METRDACSLACCGCLVAAQAVIQDGGCPLRHLNYSALARSLGIRDDGFYQRGRPRLLAPESGEQQGPVGAKRVPVAAPMRPASAISAAAAAESPGHTVRMTTEFN
jgi:hypothetical protein